MATDIANVPPTPLGAGSATAGSGLTLSGGVLTNDLLTGKAGGQTAKGGTAAGESLTLRGTAHANNDGTVVVTSANTVATTPVLTVESTAASGYALLSMRSNGAERGGFRSDFAGTTRLYSSGGLDIGGGGGATTPSIKVLSTGETVVQIGLFGSTSASGTWTIGSTTNATKGFVYLGSSTGLSYDETNKRLGIGVAVPAFDIQITKASPVLNINSNNNAGSAQLYTTAGSTVVSGIAYGSTAAGTTAGVTNAGSAVIALSPVSNAAVVLTLNAFDLVFGTANAESYRVDNATNRLKFPAASITANGAGAVTAPGSIGPSAIAVQEWLTVKNAGGATRYIALYG